MFGASKSADIQIGGLEAELQRSFDSKVAWLDRKGAGTISALDIEWAAFNKACDALDRIESDPDVSDFFRVSISAVKSQKGAYTRALRQAAAGRQKAADYPTAYAKYSAALEATDDAINNVLQTNTQFKHVFFGYSRHLGTFKDVFRRIERLRDSLKKELERASVELAPYEETRIQVEKLLELEDEITTLNELLSGTDQGAGPDGAQNQEDESRLAGKIEKLYHERDALAASVKNITSKIITVLMPLGRAARKYDYISKQKVKLTGFVDTPLEKITNSDDYSVFQSEALRLKEALITKKVDIGDAEEAIGHIETIMQRDIYGEIEELKAVQERVNDTKKEIHALEKTLEEIRRGNRSAHEHVVEFARIKESLERRGKDKTDATVAVEGLFLKNYGKKINIIDDQDA
jgi:hypothetical protein